MAHGSILKEKSKIDKPKNMLNKFKSIFESKKDTSTTKELPQPATSVKGSRNALNSTPLSDSDQNDIHPLNTPLSAEPSIKLPEKKTEGSTTDHGLSSSETVRSKSDDGVAAEDEAKSNDLWKHAYEIVKRRNQEMVTAYEHYLGLLDPGHTSSTSPSLNPELLESIIQPKLDDREARRLVLHLGRKPIKVREQGEKILKFILWSNSAISAAVSANPFAALAWSGISLVVPLFLNSSDQNQNMLEGLAFISDYLRLYKYKEQVYLERLVEPNHSELFKPIADLYANIFEYQISLIRYLSKSSLKRGIQGTMKMDDWNVMLEAIKKSDENCCKYSAVSSEEEARHYYDNETSQMAQSIDIQRDILEMLEASRIQKQKDRRDDQEAKVLNALASDYKSDKDSISTRVSGTCEWLFEDDRFVNWRDNKSSSILWVSAGPGCGKSVLSRALVDERRVCTNVMTSSICYFFFKDGQEHRTRGANALSAILHQLFENANLISHALPSYRSYGDKLQGVFSELWEVLVKSAKDPEAGEIICVIDALDECEETTRDQLMNKLFDFFSPEASSEKVSCTLKFLITSRPYDDIEQRFDRLSRASTYLHLDGDDKSDRIGQEINLVIDAKIPHIAGGFSDQDRARISDRLKQMNNRTYLWLYLTIDIIEKSRSKYSKPSSVNTLLSNLPVEISDAYEQILDKSSDEDRALILLQMIVAASRPLTLTEANIALTIATQGGCTAHKALDVWPSQDFKSTVRNFCGLFVSIHDEKLSLIHQTAREFLIQSTESEKPHTERWQGCFDIAAAHSTMFKICFDYLTFEEFATLEDIYNEKHNDEEYIALVEERCKNFPFLEYAAENWMNHYKSQASESAMASQKLAERLCNASLAEQRNWYKIELIAQWGFFPGNDLSSLEIASLFGLTNIAQTFLNEEEKIHDLLRSSGALCLASARGHEKMVKMLLDKGADINAKYEGQTALQMASYENQEVVVQLLLQNGADVNARNGIYDSALQAASAHGHEKIVQMLIKNGADVNARNRIYDTVACIWVCTFSTQGPGKKKYAKI